MKLTHASTFSGIGAPEIAAEMLGWDNVFHCEINPFGRAILDYYFPNSASYEDITKTDFSQWRGKVTVLTGGFPCQPFSYAGKRRGSEDDRYLWPYMLRCIEQVQPDWFIGENVAGITTMVFPGEDVKVGSTTDLFGEGDTIIDTHERYVLNEICQGLERAGYSVQPLLIPACAVGAPHRRDRVWIIAHREHAILEDTMHSRQLEREHDQQGSERNIGDTCTGDNERVCSRTPRTEIRPTTNTPCSGSGVQVESGGTDGSRSNGLPQQSERRDTTQRTDGLPAIQKHATYTTSSRRREIYQQLQPQQSDGAEPISDGRKRNVTDTKSKQSGRSTKRELSQSTQEQLGGGSGKDYLLPDNRWRAFPTQSPVYRGNDGLPFDVDDLTIPFSEWKKESLKAYGNAWCVQVGYEIMRTIDEYTHATF